MLKRRMVINADWTPFFFSMQLAMRDACVKWCPRVGRTPEGHGCITGHQLLETSSIDGPCGITNKPTVVSLSDFLYLFCLLLKAKGRLLGVKVGGRGAG